MVKRDNKINSNEKKEIINLLVVSLFGTMFFFASREAIVDPFIEQYGAMLTLVFSIFAMLIIYYLYKLK